MPGCCDPQGFDESSAHGSPAGWRGATASAGWAEPSATWSTSLSLAAWPGRPVLEIGGGVGEIQLELLKRGAARTTNLELVDVLRRPGRRAGPGGRPRPTAIERRLHDIVEAPDEVERADVVVLHRVVCCYPDYERLLGAAADHAGRPAGVQPPAAQPGTRAFVAVENAVLRLTGRRYQSFAHPPEAMLAVSRDRGLTAVHTRPRAGLARGGTWSACGLRRTRAPGAPRSRGRPVRQDGRVFMDSEGKTQGHPDQGLGRDPRPAAGGAQLARRWRPALTPTPR